MTIDDERREQRRYQRIRLSVPVRFLAHGGNEQGATLLDISAGGLAVTTGDRPPIGTQVVVYVEALGRVEGHVVRHLGNGFAVEFAVTDAKRERLIARLGSLVEGPGEEHAEKSDAAERPHFTLKDGREVECRVLDMSVHSVWLQVGVKPAVGEEVTIGRMRGRVRRHHPTGVEIEFVRAAG
ncbi:MAG: PilZ domain-containing protein [Alphaproteobacteria bacterium]